MIKYDLPKWSITQQLALRAFSIYLILYFTFVSYFGDGDFVFRYINPGLQSLYSAFANFSYKLFFQHEFKEKPIIDSYLTYTAVFSFLLIAVASAIIWTAIDKGKRLLKLYKYMHVFARFYLAIILFDYAIDKLCLLQFTLHPAQFLQPVGNMDPHILFWLFVGSSKGYQFFGGLMEMTAIIFLLFRRTATFGGLISLAFLINILILDVGYDTPVKVTVFHLLLFDVMVLVPDIKRLFEFFILGKNKNLTNIPPLIENKKYRFAAVLAKICFICYIIFPAIYYEWKAVNEFGQPSHIKLVGLYKINEFSRIPTAGIPGSIDTVSWKQLAIDNFPVLTVQKANDSIADYHFEADTLHKFLILKDWGDPAFVCNLHYSNNKANEWLFDGVFKNDSIRFSTTQINIFDLPLLKGYGKIKWEWKHKGYSN
ncbi:MAG: hypothetical protein JWR61_4700 [Ferruginibacter sp.]|uniref:hypothetical protein n=1 Tax=Ferruginibacter sp. TaxID=1940288 RepID=UPI002658A9A9|nr:hypothetical protein [Ferruginibacter sp.]MDB5279745.1 hypothetical protein [Ferruginibacter sp.]